MEVSRGALIVTGGRSFRMGRPKAWLDLHGTPLLRHIVNIARGCCPVVVVAASPGQELPDLPSDVLRVDDPSDQVDAGPLAGALCGLTALQKASVELAYIGACDTPWVDEAHVCFMLEELSRDPGCQAIVPETDPVPDGRRHLHPLSGAVRVPVARAMAQALIESGQRAMRSLHEGLDARRISVAQLPNVQAVLSCDTPEQWKAALDSVRPR